MTALSDEEVGEERPPTAAAGAERDATSPLRMVAYCCVLAAVAFNQSPGLIAPDTKIDLAVDPWGFLGRALHLWDPTAAFGQVQNQAYGYFWPMGPFFGVGDWLGMPAWVTQRLWWTMLLVVGFVGVVLLCRAMSLGKPWIRVVAGFAFAFSVHTITLIGPTSVEAWPSAMAPWVLLPLVRGSHGGSVRRHAALAALAVAMCGGVNAAATSAVLPLGVLWLVTRAPSRRQRSLFLWWVLFTALATLWWLVPLLLLGSYSPPFLDYIENATITTLPTGLSDVVAGTSNWVAFTGAVDWRAGALLAETPILIIDATVVAGLGLAGIIRRDNPHRSFLFVGVLAGLLLVSFGYAGELAGWAAAERQQLLDGGLAPLRNLHKYDVVLRLPLVLGLAHLLSRLSESRTESSAPREQLAARLVRGSVTAVALVGVLGVAAPALLWRLAPSDSFEAVPPYWSQVASYLEDNQDQGRALVVPAAAFGEYWWGSTHDDALQPLAESPWAVRNVIPLAQPGNIRYLDAVTELVEAGEPSAQLAPLLAAGGVGLLVVRNDLDPGQTGAPDLVLLHQALDRSPGLVRVAEFGPELGADAVFEDDEGRTIFANRGRSATFASVEIYAVTAAPDPVEAWVASTVPVVAGGPRSPASLTTSSGSPPTILAGDATNWNAQAPTVVTDNLRKRENNFAEVRDNQSATLGENDRFRLDAVQPNYRLFEEQTPYEATTGWQGVRDVSASSSQAYADAVGRIEPARSPAAAVDGDPDTAWQSSGFDGAVGQWWRVDFDKEADPRSIRMRLGDAVGPAVTTLRITTAAGSQEVAAPAPDAETSFLLPTGSTSFVTVEAVSVEESGSGVAWSLAEVVIEGVSAQGHLQVPSEGVAATPEMLLLERNAGRSACALVDRVYTCDDVWFEPSDEPGDLRRLVTVPGTASGSYEPVVEVTLGPELRSAEQLMELSPTQAQVSSQLSADARSGAWAVIDGEPATTWVADPTDDRPTMVLQWTEPVEISSIRLDLTTGAAASPPTEVEVVSKGSREIVELDADGRGEFESTTRRLRIRFTDWVKRLSQTDFEPVALPVGVSAVTISRAPVLDLGATTQLARCGEGPVLSIDGVAYPTRVTGSPAALLEGRPAEATLCEDQVVSMPAGQQLVSVDETPTFRADRVRLDRAGGGPIDPASVDVQVGEWGSVERSLRVAAREAPALVVVHENINAGWQARLGDDDLPAVRVDGWQQGWVLPAGDAATVTLTYGPDPVYRWGLLAGLAGVLLVVAAAMLGPRRPESAPAVTAPAWSLVVLGPLLIAALGLLAGWWGAAVAVAAVLIGVSRFGRWSGWPGMAAGFVAVAGAATAYERSDGATFGTLWPQLLVLLAVGCAGVTFLRGSLRFRNRDVGRSTR